MKRWSLLLISIFFLMLRVNSWAGDFGQTPKLAARGEASIFKPADQMEVSLGIVTRAESSSEALNENNRRMHQIIANLQDLGLDNTDYQTGRFHIQPIYQKPSKDSEEDERAKIALYEVVNTIQIKTQKIDLADKMIKTAIEGGANQVDQVNFSLNNPQAYRTEAIKIAAQNAVADATALANAVNVKLKRILNLSLDHWQQFPMPIMMYKSVENVVDAQDRGRQETLEAGKAEIHATVNVIFEIEQ